MSDNKICVMSRKNDLVRIGIDARELTHPHTGIGCYVLHLVQVLAEIDDKNEYFLFIGTEERRRLGNLELPPNFFLIEVPAFSIDKLQDQIGLVRAMRGLDLDVFHVTHHDVTPLLCRIPLIVTVHDIAPMDFPNPSWVHRMFYSIFSRLALSRACHVLCDSNSTGQRIEQHFPFCAGKWSTVYLGRDPYFRVRDELQGFSELSDRLGISRPFILYVGSFARRKNLTNMIRAFSVIKRSRPRVQFVIVGGPSGRDDVFPAEVPAGVIAVGRVTRHELRALYNNAELLLFTTLYEGFGVPVLEAMACGCPVVTSPVTSLPEVAGDAALYAAPDRPKEIAGQALRILRENGLREILAEKGLEQDSRFDWRTTVHHSLQVYHRVLARSKAHR